MNAAAAWTLDASVAIKWYLRDEDLLDRADAVLMQYGEGDLDLVATAYLLDEAGNILRSAVRRRRLTSEPSVGAITPTQAVAGGG